MLQAASGGNMHAFTAASSCAVLDLLAPPYDPNDRAHIPPPLACPLPALRDLSRALARVVLLSIGAGSFINKYFMDGRNDTYQKRVHRRLLHVLAGFRLFSLFSGCADS